MKRAIFCLVAAMAFSAPTAFSVPDVSHAAAAAVSTEKFVTTAGVAGIFEVESSRLAAERAQDAKVKAFAQQMISDHTAANEELDSAVKAGGDNTPVPQDLDGKHKSMVDQLTKAKGAAFDELYKKIQLQAHMDAVDLFGTYAKSGDNKALQGFAEKTLPTLEHHLSEIKSISGGG
jgi:putative membrane protein